MTFNAQEFVNLLKSDNIDGANEYIRTVKSIDIKNNDNWDDKCTANLATILKENTALEELSLRKNNI